MLFFSAFKDESTKIPCESKKLLYSGLIFSHDFGTGTKEFVAAGTIQNSLEIWHPENGKVIRKGLGHSGSIFCIKYSAGHVFTGSDDRSIKIWDITKTGEILSTERELWGHKGRIWAIEVLDDYLISGNGLFIYFLKI